MASLRRHTTHFFYFFTFTSESSRLARTANVDVQLSSTGFCSFLSTPIIACSEFFDNINAPNRVLMQPHTKQIMLNNFCLLLLSSTRLNIAVFVL